ncbi:hypothetical protein RIF29_12088 [Crotalaria pallida]|uniref:Uncharacterized protein n=1 Tax=Crotalaria pallida TaxID=3830 RepID=A0AAN9P0N8_CROPI
MYMCVIIKKKTKTSLPLCLTTLYLSLSLSLSSHCSLSQLYLSFSPYRSIVNNRVLLSHCLEVLLSHFHSISLLIQRD